MVSNRRTIGTVALIVTALVLGPAHLGAQSGSSPRKKTTASKRSRRPASRAHTKTLVSGSRPTPVRLTKTRAHGRRVPHQRRLAMIHLQPQRVEEIQRALQGAGYLKEEPTGNWDDSTRAAMRRLQIENGFPPSGLPEAKSLMKLGLGPHPLPEDVVATGSSTARFQPNLDTGDSVAPSAPPNSTKPTPPAQP